MTEHKYISCNIVGPGSPGGIHNYGLGNQMFQVATMLSHAADIGAIAVFPDLINPDFGGYHNNIFSNLLTIPEKHTFAVGQYTHPTFEYRQLPYLINFIYSGYFQSEKYFAHNRSLILQNLNVDTIYNKIVTKYKDILSGITVSIHVRRGDYVVLSDKHPVMSLEYYKKAIQYIGKYDRLIVFSDDIEWCKTNLKFSHAKYIENEPDYIDMVLMSKCTHNIIANSTFSWWAAWLNKNKDKIVIAPKEWFGVQRNLSDVDIVPEEWVKL